MGRDLHTQHYVAYKNIVKDFDVIVSIFTTF